MNRRKIMKLAAAAGMSTALVSPAAVFAASEDNAILAAVHPELREFARTVLQFQKLTPPWSMATLAQNRGSMAPYLPKPSTDVPYEKRMIPGAKGHPDVGIYIVNAGSSNVRPAILYTHGGGFISGSALEALPDLQKLCKQLDCVAVSVDYRLAPETTFRGSIEDNYAGLKWLHANAAQLGVDPNRIAVMGESAGGGHAALLAITARDRREVPVCFQCLVYPMLDDRTGTTRAVPAHVGKLIWTPPNNRFGWKSFLGVEPGCKVAPKGAVPARIANLSGLPPAWIGVGSIDLFVDEDVDYAQRLNSVGVPTELIVVPGAFHGFDSPMAGNASISERFTAAKVDALRRGLRIPLA